MKPRTKAARRAGTYRGVRIKRKRDKGVTPAKKAPVHPKITPEIIQRHTWYALKVLSQKEFVAQAMLKERGLLTYVPVRKEWRHKNRYDKARMKKVLVSYPQAYGYVLVGFTDRQMAPGNIPYWLRLFSIPVIRGVVGIELERKPVALDHASLIELSKRFPNGMQRPDHEAFMRTHREFKPGDTVTNPNGPFDGHMLKVISIKGMKTKAIAQLFGAEHEVTLNAFDLEPVEQKAA